jgi:hypothetical protein
MRSGKGWNCRPSSVALVLGLGRSRSDELLHLLLSCCAFVWHACFASRDVL